VKYLIFLTVMFFVEKNYAQETISIDTTKWLCTYNYEFLQDSTSRYSLKQIDMVLQVGLHSSKFSNFRGFLSDSLARLENNKETNEDDAQSHIDKYMKMTSGLSTNLLAMYEIYKNYPQANSLLFTAYDEHKFLKVTQPLKMNWKLENSNDTVIAGYRCHKAFTSFAGREYIAWFTLEIPISEGPYKFNGLPGLIIKISDTRNEHRFTLTSAKKLKYIQPIIFSNETYIAITPHEYIKVLKNKINRLSGSLQNGNITLTSEEGKAQSLQRLKTKNNFIEKY
jgi:GLPGLI family protein